jgi:twitching motility protein PilI
VSKTTVDELFGILRDYEIRAIAETKRVPRGRFGAESRRGIGFRLDTLRLAAPIDDVREIIKFPMLYAVPGAKSWIRGIANAGGHPLTVVDLKRFFGQPTTHVTRATRVLAVESEVLSVGLTVDEVFGFVELSPERFGPVPSEAQSWIRPYLKGGCRSAEQDWALMDFSALLGAPEFMRAAA